MSTVSERAAQLATQVATLSPPYVAATVQSAIASGLVKGVTDGSFGAAGEIGEYKEVTFNGYASLVTATPTTIATIALTPGDWDMSLSTNAYLSTGTGTYWIAGISDTTNVRALPFNEGGGGNINTVTYVQGQVSQFRHCINFSASLFAVVQSSFSTAGACRVSGRMSARRVR